MVGFILRPHYSQGKSRRYPLNRRLSGSRMYVVHVNQSAQTLLVSPFTLLRNVSVKCNLIKTCSFVSLSWLCADRRTQVNRLIHVRSDGYESLRKLLFVEIVRVSRHVMLQKLQTSRNYFLCVRYRGSEDSKSLRSGRRRQQFSPKRPSLPYAHSAMRRTLRRTLSFPEHVSVYLWQLHNLIACNF